MRSLFLISCLVLVIQLSHGQESPKTSITAGVLNGGGSLFGVDAEFLLNNRMGFQVGAGFVGYGTGINYHLSPGLRSSFISIQYWNQGIGNSFVQNLIGPSFVYRSKKWFTGQIGVAGVLNTGPNYPFDKVIPVILTYSVGIYIVN